MQDSLCFTHFSHSGIQLFKACPLRFKFKYIVKPTIELKETIEAFVGKRFHETMQFLYNCIHYNKNPTLNDLIEFFSQQWQKNWNNSIVILTDSLSKEDYFNYGIKCIENYYNKHKPFNDSITLATEKEVLFKLDEGIMIKGIIDRLAKKEQGIYEIHDYKTTANLPSKEMIEEDLQLPLYALGVINEFDNVKEIHLIWHYVGFNEEFVIKRKPEDFEKIKLIVINLIKEIQKEKEFKAMPSALCAYCEFQELCPEWAHILSVQKLSVNKYLNEPGVKLANKYIELKNKKKEFNEKIDAELKELEDALFFFGEKNNYSVIAGSEFNLKLWKSKSFELPPKDSKEFQEITELLKKNGLLENFLTIDRFALIKMLSNDSMPTELKEKILKYAVEKEVRRIYFKQAQESE